MIAIVLNLFNILLITSSCLAATIQFEVKNSTDPGESVEEALVVAYPQGKIPTLVPKEYRIEQKDKSFAPRILPIELGSKVSFPNLDPFSHSVYALSNAKAFELPLYKYNDPTPPPVVFEKAGHVVLGCNIHDEMVGHIFVLESPHFALSAKGRATLQLEPGKYELRAWHKRLKAKKMLVAIPTLEVQGDATQAVALELDPPPSAAPSKKGKWNY